VANPVALAPVLGVVDGRRRALWPQFQDTSRAVAGQRAV